MNFFIQHSLQDMHRNTDMNQDMCVNLACLVFMITLQSIGIAYTVKSTPLYTCRCTCAICRYLTCISSGHIWHVGLAVVGNRS